MTAFTDLASGAAFAAVVLCNHPDGRKCTLVLDGTSAWATAPTSQEAMDGALGQLLSQSDDTGCDVAREREVFPWRGDLPADPLAYPDQFDNTSRDRARGLA